VGRKNGCRSLGEAGVCGRHGQFPLHNQVFQEQNEGTHSRGKLEDI